MRRSCPQNKPMVHLISLEQRKNKPPLGTIENKVPQIIYEAILPNRMAFSMDASLETIAQAREWLKKFPKAKICHLIDHEPVLTDAYVKALESSRYSLEEVVTMQRLKDADGSWFIDEYGFYLYAVPILSLTGEDITEDHTESKAVDFFATI